MYQVPLIFRFLAYAVYILLWGLVADCYPNKAFNYVAIGNTFIWKHNHGKDELKMSSVNCTFDVVSFLVLPFSAALLVCMNVVSMIHPQPDVCFFEGSIFCQVLNVFICGVSKFPQKIISASLFLEDAVNLRILSPLNT